MAPLNESQARIIDPILSTHARGYKHASNVGHYLFPDVFVDQMAGTRLEFGKESFQRLVSVRAPGADTKQLQFGYEGKPFVLRQHRLEAKAPKEHVRAAGVPGINIRRVGIDAVRNIHSLEEEVEKAQLALNAANYANSNKETLSGSDKWSDDASKPQDQVDDGKEAVRVRTGMHPNVMVIPPKVVLRLRKHPLIKAHFSSSVAPNPDITLERLAEYFKIKRVVSGDRTYSDGNDFLDVWNTGVVMAYVPETNEGADRGNPSYGYNYKLRNNPTVEQTYWSKGNQSWLTPVEDNYAPQIVGAESGFLFDAVL